MHGITASTLVLSLLLNSLAGIVSGTFYLCIGCEDGFCIEHSSDSCCCCEKEGASEIIEQESANKIVLAGENCGECTIIPLLTSFAQLVTAEVARSESPNSSDYQLLACFFASSRDLLIEQARLVRNSSPPGRVSPVPSLPLYLLHSTLLI